MLKWEEISHDNGFFLRRTKVFGGWLVVAIMDAYTSIPEGPNSFLASQGYEWRTSITFVPDPTHEWKVNEKEPGLI